MVASEGGLEVRMGLRDLDNQGDTKGKRGSREATRRAGGQHREGETH